MEENNELIVTEADFEGFEDGWDDETSTPVGEDDDLEPDEGEIETDEADGEPEETEETETKGEETEEKPADNGDHTAEQVIPERKKFTLKHLDDVKEVDEEEIIPLAQKGLDYDRIRKRSEEYEGFLKEIAGGRTIDELIDSVRAAKISKELGIDTATAMERVKLDKEKRTIESEKELRSAAENEKMQKQKAEEARKQDFLAFAKEYPGVQAQDIPKEVWERVRGGEKLTDAYAKHELGQLRERVKALESEKKTLEQTVKNKQRTTGSRATAGEKKETDPFDDGWSSWD